MFYVFFFFFFFSVFQFFSFSEIIKLRFHSIHEAVLVYSGFLFLFFPTAASFNNIPLILSTRILLRVIEGDMSFTDCGETLT